MKPDGWDVYAREAEEETRLGRRLALPDVFDDGRRMHTAPPIRHFYLAAALALLPGCGACDAFDPVDAPAPNIPLETLDGETVELSSFRGRPVVVHFWLPSCHVCIREFPDLLEARSKAQENDVAFLAVSIDPDADNIRSTAKRLGVDMPLLVARGEVLGPMYVGAAPSTVFIDRDGTIRAAVSGARTTAFHTRRIRDLMDP